MCRTPRGDLNIDSSHARGSKSEVSYTPSPHSAHPAIPLNRINTYESGIVRVFGAFRAKHFDGVEQFPQFSETNPPQAPKHARAPKLCTSSPENPAPRRDVIAEYADFTSEVARVWGFGFRRPPCG